jgi:hypothetical protein
MPATTSDLVTRIETTRVSGIHSCQFRDGEPAVQTNSGADDSGPRFGFSPRFVTGAPSRMHRPGGSWNRNRAGHIPTLRYRQWFRDCRAAQWAGFPWAEVFLDGPGAMERLWPPVGPASDPGFVPGVPYVSGVPCVPYVPGVSCVRGSAFPAAGPQVKIHANECAKAGAGERTRREPGSFARVTSRFRAAPPATGQVRGRPAPAVFRCPRCGSVRRPGGARRSPGDPQKAFGCRGAIGIGEPPPHVSGAGPRPRAPGACHR